MTTLVVSYQLYYFLWQYNTFAQVISKIPRDLIKSVIRKYGTDKHAKGFNSWSHLISMIFVNSPIAYRCGKSATGLNRPQVT